jgi:hypothetical protein
MKHAIIITCIACTVYHHNAYIHMCLRSLSTPICYSMWDGLTSHPTNGQICTLSDDAQTVTCTLTKGK